MKTILEKVKKWFASVRSEIPAFCKLCKVTISLIAKTVKKQDASIDKSAFAELRTKTLNAQIAFGGVLVILTAIVFARGCGHNHSTGCVTYADADTRKAVLAQVELEKQRAIKAEVEQKEAEAKRAAEEARRDAADEAKKQKHKELGAWYSAERKKLENQKKAAEAEIERSQYERAHAIRIEKGWPEIGFPGLDGIVLAEPLPEKYSNYAQVEYPVTIKDLPMFTSLEIRGVRPGGVNEPAGLRGVVDEIRLNGKTSMTAKQAIEAMQKLSKQLDATWKTSHMNLGKDQIFQGGDHEIAARQWEGLPKWHALLQCQVYEVDGKMVARFALSICSDGNSIYGKGICGVMRGQLENERLLKLRQNEEKFKAQEELLEQELHRKQNEIK